MKFLAIYLRNGDNYNLYGFYPVNDEDFVNAEHKFRSIRSFIADSTRQAFILYENNGEPMKVYPAFPVEQVDTEYGPFTLEWLHRNLFDSPYISSEWLDDLHL